MKTFALLAIASASDKKVPPRHPMQRLARLSEFAQEWFVSKILKNFNLQKNQKKIRKIEKKLRCDANLTQSQAENWKGKFRRNTARFGRRFELCGYYDDTNLPHGGPKADRKRRSDLECDIDDDDCIFRYDKVNPIRGIQQITKGYLKWAQRYIVKCKLQPDRQVDRSNKWYGMLTSLYGSNVGQ